MLKILSGWFEAEEHIPYWLQGKMSILFTKFITEDWLKDPIILDELRDVDDIVRVDGFNLYKSNGSRIPVDWISQGSKQFIYTVNMLPREIVDCYHVGWNVFKYFYLWCKDKNVDITLLTNTNEMILIDDCEMQGKIINREGIEFHSNRELADYIYDFREDELLCNSENKDWVLRAKFSKGGFYNIKL